ncbi:hypothetical protein [Variovorax sp. J31P207]|uniref:hypothetical protein n=1 Tax=Variovorax sp. J31P207 TaxID=3053510 RepID=UPI00257773DB|nr:hypothetical protein [Variovorax sp. J31P207]MDM0071750.1 hypothetical protein [Variovorax sp. J31P207]
MNQQQFETFMTDQIAANAAPGEGTDVQLGRPSMRLEEYSPANVLTLHPDPVVRAGMVASCITGDDKAQTGNAMKEPDLLPLTQREQPADHEDSVPVPWTERGFIAVLLAFGVFYVGWSHMNTLSEWDDGRDRAELVGAKLAAGGAGTEADRTAIHADSSGSLTVKEHPHTAPSLIYGGTERRSDRLGADPCALHRGDAATPATACVDHRFLSRTWGRE